MFEIHTDQIYDGMSAFEKPSYLGKLIALNFKKQLDIVLLSQIS
jgi:hypothetical protein